MSEDKQTSSTQNKSIKSEMIKSGKRTYFLDMMVSQKGDKYLKITETRFVDEKQPRQRSSILVFSQDIENFRAALNRTCDFATASQ